MKTLRLLLVTLALLFLAHPTRAESLLNLKFGPGTKTSPAAVGAGTNDNWNHYFPTNNDGTLFDPGLLLPLLGWDGTNIGAGLVMMNVQTSVVTSITEPLFGSYLAVTETNLYLTFTNLPPASYDVYIYAPGEDGNHNSAVGLAAAWTDHGWLTTTNSESWGSLEWAEGVQYVVFRDVMVPSGQALAITISPDASALALLNGIQFVGNDLATNRDTDGDGLTDLD